ncbi:MAG: hypothetical protein A3J46_06390 [Candidatus Yanofskybacteria bacterium RIFCSPHIGHO2_02_FULL_41_11]|uniref:Oxidized purine nucleoside triphosphate hydrolase n=1 Tax=Candidatus Yanofskybacteria bacterium RIFCSPHIGHO2_02_FULL_41_11 TaxID=1802675 RepID=A0A1F8FDY1_9BACT|nr:MAG: hypothetical protein A3J46_06390 [Candidatus Yanofskybacteria bacterium RIFCSPHIGHO2_02_FULL_41_11]
MRKVLTLCIIHQHPRVLLGVKKRGFGVGKYNGFGGKLNEGETIEEAAKREIKEETGLTVNNLYKLGTVDFRWQGKPEIMEVHVFKANQYEGEPSESEEMKPEWFHVDKIPFDKMWQDDKHWFPLFLSDKKFIGKFLFDEKDNIIEHELNEI